MTTGKAMELVARLREAADDPMWVGHAEVPKVLLASAADALEASESRSASLAEEVERLRTFPIEWVRFVDATFGPVNADAAMNELGDDHELTLTVAQMRSFYLRACTLLSENPNG